METFYFKDYAEYRAFLREGRTFVEPERVGVVQAEPQPEPEKEVEDAVSPKRSNRSRAKRDTKKDSNE